MIEPVQEGRGVGGGFAFRHGGAIDHEDGDSGVLGSFYFGVHGLSACIFGDECLDGVYLQEGGFIGFGEGASGEEEGVIWGEGVLGGRVYAADDVVVLGGAAEWGDALAACGEEDALGQGFGEDLGGGLEGLGGGPAVLRVLGPGGAFEADEGGVGLCAGVVGVLGDPGGEGVGGVDHGCDGVGSQPFGEAGRAAEAADAGGGFREVGVFRGACEGEDGGEVRALGEGVAEGRGLGGAAEDEDGERV